MSKGVLYARVLVLNRNWVPVSTTSVRGAFALLCRGAASVVCTETYECFDLEGWVGRRAIPGASVGTPRGRVLVPEVLVLSWSGGRPRGDVSFTRRNLFRRDGYRCQYCGENVRNREKSIDHVVPRSKGGQTSWENCVLSCLPCNYAKGDRTPREAGLALVARPARPAWTPLAETDLQEVPAGWVSFLGRVGREAC